MTKEEALKQIKKTIPYLVLKYYKKEIKGFKKETDLTPYKNRIIHFPLSSEWVDHLWVRAAEDLFSVPCRTGDEFRKLIRDKGGDFYGQGCEWKKLLISILDAYSQWRDYLQTVKNVNLTHLKEYLNEREKEGEDRLSGVFLLKESKDNLLDYPRFYRCLKARTEKGLQDLPLDRARQEEWDRFRQEGIELEERISPHASEKRHQAQRDFNLHLREYYYALFCQSEKRKVKVSPKRLREMLLEMERMV